MASNEQLIDRAEARLEQLLENNATLGSSWRDMVGSMQDEAGQLAVDAVTMATRANASELAAHSLSERFEALAERIEGVGMGDIAESLRGAAASLDAADSNSMARASEAALQSSQELGMTADMSREFDGSRALPTAEATTVVETPAAMEDAQQKFGGFSGNNTVAPLLNFIDGYRKEAGMDSLRKSSVLFRDMGGVGEWLAEKVNSFQEATDPKKELEGALAQLGSASSALAAAQEKLAEAGTGPMAGAAREGVDSALADFNKAEAAVGTALNEYASALSVPGIERLEAVSATEASMEQFLEAGGVMTGDIARDVRDLDNLAGLTVREFDAADVASLDADGFKDLGGMLDVLASKADSLGLTEMSGDLRDASLALAEGAEVADLGAIREFVGETASDIGTLREAAEAFSFGASELTRDGSDPALTSAGATLDSGMTAGEVNMDSQEFAALFERGAQEGQAQQPARQAEAETEMSMDM